MTWLDTAIERASEPITVDVKPLNMGVDEIQVLPLSMKEYNGLKSNPELLNISEDDKAEKLGMLMVFEMMVKCDATLTWNKFQQLPLSLIAELTSAIMESVSTPLE